MQNDMRDRLVMLLDQRQDNGYHRTIGKKTITLEVVSNEKLADHLIANGVVVPPCKVGDVVYKLMDVETVHRRILELRVFRIAIEETGIMFVCQTTKKYRYNFDTLNFDDFGKTVFFTKEQAEQKLKEMRVE